MTVVEYNKKMRSLADDMVAEGRTLEEEELVEYTLTGFSHEYDPIVSVVIAKIGPVFVSELYAQHLVFETCLTLMRGRARLRLQSNTRREIGDVLRSRLPFGFGHVSV
jgi:hypothetical protein